MGIKTVPHPPYSRDLAPCNFWLFPKLRGCRYETTEEIKEAMTKVIDTLTQERYNIAAGGDYFEGYRSPMCTINKSAQTKKSLETYWRPLVYGRLTVYDRL